MGRSRSRSYSRSRSRSSDYEMEGTRVHVGELPVGCEKRDLEKVFDKFGPINEVWMAKNPPCFAFIVYRHSEDAEQAVRELNGMTFYGSRVRVSLALPRARERRRRPGFDMNLRCYQCGEVGHFSRDCEGGRSNRTRPSPRRRSRSPRRPHRSSSSKSASRSRSREHKRKGTHKRSSKDGKDSEKKNKSKRRESEKGREVEEQPRGGENADYEGGMFSGVATAGGESP